MVKKLGGMLLVKVAREECAKREMLLERRTIWVEVTLCRNQTLLSRILFMGSKLRTPICLRKGNRFIERLNHPDFLSDLGSPDSGSPGFAYSRLISPRKWILARKLGILIGLTLSKRHIQLIQNATRSVRASFLQRKFFLLKISSADLATSKQMSQIVSTDLLIFIRLKGEKKLLGISTVQLTTPHSYLKVNSGYYRL